MVLNAQQISDTISDLKTVLAQQEEILSDMDVVMIQTLPTGWQCMAQEAYQQSYLSLKESVLGQINSLIALFSRAFEESQHGLYQVNVDVANMNATAIVP